MNDRSALGPPALTGDLIDAIAETVLESPHPRGRANAICTIVGEILDSVAWFHGSQAVDDYELASLQHLLEAAQAHRQRMDDWLSADPAALPRAS